MPRFGSLHPSIEVGNKYKNTAFPRNGCVWHVGSDHSQRQRLIIIILLAMIEVPFFPLLMITSGICSYQCDVYWNWLPFMAVSSQMRVRNAHACSQRSARRQSSSL